MIMGKYTHLTEDEIVSHIEKFGTEDEREIMALVRPLADWNDCPVCEEKDSELIDLETKIEKAIEALE